MEIIILLFIIGYLRDEVYKDYSSDSSRIITAFKATIDPYEYYEENLC